MIVELRTVLAAALLAGLLGVAAADAAGRFPPEVEASLERADALIKIEQLEEALAVLKSIETEDSAVDARIETLLGKIYLRIAKPAKALDLFEHASFNTLDDAEPHLGMAQAAMAMGNLKRARRQANMALRTDPDLTEAHLVIALIDDRSGKVEEAHGRFLELRRHQPDNEEVVVAYGRFLAEREGLGEASRLLTGYIDRHPFAPEASDLLGQLYWRAGGRVEDALRYRAAAAKAFELQGNHYRAEGLRDWLAANDPSGRFSGQPAPEPKKTTPPPAKPEAKPPAAPTPPQPVTQPPRPAPAPPPKTQTAKVQPKDPVPPPGVQSPRARPDRPARPAPQVTPKPAPAPQPVAAVMPRHTVLKRPEPLPLRPGSKFKSGSGFVVDGGRRVVTNRHVIDGMSRVVVRSGTGEVRHAKVAAIAPNDDLAVLDLAKAFPASYAVPFSAMSDPSPGRAAVVMGYPMMGILGSRQPSLTEGIVSKSSGMGDDPNTFFITSKMNKGNSGGPIFDRRGNLIGVAVAKLDALDVYEKKGYMPEDVNVGIKANRVLRFLKRPAKPREGQAVADAALEDLYQGMLARVVLVVGEVK